MGRTVMGRTGGLPLFEGKARALYKVLGRTGGLPPAHGSARSFAASSGNPAESVKKPSPGQNSSGRPIPEKPTLQKRLRKAGSGTIRLRERPVGETLFGPLFGESSAKKLSSGQIASEKAGSGQPPSGEACSGKVSSGKGPRHAPDAHAASVPLSGNRAARRTRAAGTGTDYARCLVMEKAIRKAGQGTARAKEREETAFLAQKRPFLHCAWHPWEPRSRPLRNGCRKPFPAVGCEKCRTGRRRQKRLPGARPEAP